MAVLTPEELPNYSYDDYQSWDGRWELIEGIPFAMSPSPSKDHQSLAMRIGAELLTALNTCTECEVLLDTDWLVGARTVFRPDIAVVCHDDNRKHVTVTPEVIVEIVSPSTASRDEGLKFRLYQEEEVSYYVLVYPEHLTAKVFQLKSGAFVEVAVCDVQAFTFESVTCPFELNFEVVFRQWRT